MTFQDGNKIIAVGRVTREAKIRNTRTGKPVATFAMHVGYHHNEDGKAVADYMDVSMWEEDAKYAGDENVGIAKDDIVLVVGYLVRDKYKEEKSNDGEKYYKINADILYDMTSSFQVAQMVVEAGFSPDVPAEAEDTPRTPKKQSVFADVDDSDDDNPFMPKEVEEENDLPY
jgi:Single-stranded DNA-binding protein